MMYCAQRSSDAPRMAQWQLLSSQFLCFFFVNIILIRFFFVFFTQPRCDTRA